MTARIRAPATANVLRFLSRGDVAPVFGSATAAIEPGVHVEPAHN
jgi:hypothetical protein